MLVVFRGQSGEEVAEFGVDVIGAGHGLGDFCAEEVAIAVGQGAPDTY